MTSIQRRKAFWGQVINYGKAATRYAETGELVDGSAWKTVLAFYQASQLWQWVTSDSTYQEMRSGGELGLIHDQGLREMCIRDSADGMPADEIVHAFAGNPRLLAAARNYWLYTNRHLKLMRELRIEANAMIARIQSEETP